MPTEDDLRAALTSLERHAPVPARVLPGAGRPSPAPRRLPRLSTRWVAGIAAIAAVAGAVTALTLAGGPSDSGVHPAAQAKLLAAFSATAGDIVYAHSTDTVPTGKGNVIGGQDGWDYPAQPAPGQQVRDRTLQFDGKGNPLFDTELSYRAPAAGATAPSSSKGYAINVDYSGKTWSVHNLNCVSCLAVPDEATVSSMAQLVKEGRYREVGTGTVDGHRAVEFHIDQPSDNDWNMWVDAASYLPLRWTVSSPGTNGTQTSTVDFQFLPPTPANLAKLTVPIPPGFHRLGAATR